MKLTKKIRHIAAELARRYVEFYLNRSDGRSPSELKLWGLGNWGYIKSSLESDAVRLADPRPQSREELIAQRGVWYYPSPDFLQEVVLPFIEIYKNETDPEKCLRWFEGNYPSEVYKFKVTKID